MTPSRRPPTPSGSNTTWPASPTACPTATAAGHPERDCPHPNACLTCPDFQTTPEFLAVHRAQAATNRTLIARAEADGRFRLVTNLRRTQDSLDAIIPSLEALQRGGETDAS